MGKSKAYVVDIDGKIRENPDFPIAVVRRNLTKEGHPLTSVTVDAILTDKIIKNLYGRIITLVEATTEAYKLKAVKDLFGKEIRDWSTDVYGSIYDNGLIINAEMALDHFEKTLEQ
jgi:hypothetical protein